jgi:hypothetical protein
MRVTDSGILGVRTLCGLDLTKVTEWLRTCTQDFKPSQLYSAAADAKFVDNTQRLSEYIHRESNPQG